MAQVDGEGGPSTNNTNRITRRPFGPRLPQRDHDAPSPTRPKGAGASTAGSPSINVVWAHTQTPIEDEGAPSFPTEPVPGRRSRPLPPKPRNTLNDSRRRPLPSAKGNVSTHDVPFAFSSRTSQYADVHGPGKINGLSNHGLHDLTFII